MSSAWIVAAKRTAVTPRNGAWAVLEPHLLMTPVIRALLADTALGPDAVDGVVMGNALYGGGNPARLAALSAGVAEDVPAMTLDTQCCGGMDAIGLAALRVASGQHEVVIAGGLESYSRSPRRFKRAVDKDGTDEEYARPPFSPWTDRDPDMIDAAAALARHYRIPRTAQESFAIESHRKALHAMNDGQPDIVAVDGVTADAFTRSLSHKLCQKLPLLAGDEDYGLTSATTAVEADGAAAVLVVSDAMLSTLQMAGQPLKIVHHVSTGGDPEVPALAPVVAARKLLAQAGLTSERIEVAEVMEAFGVQAMVAMDELGLSADQTNRSGGALARGHPIGASGAINVVRLWHELQHEPAGVAGLAMIAAAGGLGSALLLGAK